ncbi:hypothetical protein [Saccharopolyspora pogona]|uniref:hypothetical protein n=1 Tax=Saccharopolyspora pogona TaxID=333966 RepID=UPI001687E13E|nr:hypothetical protein [Saccharopolyspora pogona]
MNEAFAPSNEQREWAQRVLDAVGTACDPGAVRIDGRMIDRPLIEQARCILNSPGTVVA